MNVDVGVDVGVDVADFDVEGCIATVSKRIGTKNLRVRIDH
jgi:hypothetical protein